MGVGREPLGLLGHLAGGVGEDPLAHRVDQLVGVLRDPAHQPVELLLVDPVLAGQPGGRRLGVGDPGGQLLLQGGRGLHDRARALLAHIAEPTGIRHG